MLAAFQKQSRTRRRLSVIGLVAVSIGATGAVPPTPDCTLASDWATANRDALPTSLVEIREFAAPWRRAIITNLPTETRTRLWREHFAEVLQRESLADEQRSFVRELDENIGRLFSLPQQVAQREIATDWEPRMWRLFPGERNPLVYRIFYSVVGDAEGDGRRPVVVQASTMPGLSSNYVRSLVNMIAPSFVRFPVDCDCRNSSSCGIFDCSDLSSCEPTDDGCGIGGMQECYGMCY